MNSIVLMAEVLTDPELRRTPDNQSSIASLLVQFTGGRAEDAPYRIKVVGWNNLADEIVEKYHKGDQIVIEGRLRLDLVDRGTYKEKRTELVAQRIYGFGAGVASTTSSTASVNVQSNNRTTKAPSNPPSPPSSAPNNSSPSSNAYVPVASPSADAPDYDDIPF